MVICWNFGAIKIYLEMSEHMTSVDTVCSPCYVDVVDFGKSDDEKPEKLEALVAAVHSGGTSHIIHIPAGGVLSDIIFSSPLLSEDRGSTSGAVASGVSSFEF